MEDYGAKYEEYKQSILQNRWFIEKLNEKYTGSLRSEKDYIDENGVLWKTSVLSGVFGLCISLFWILEDRSDTGSIITRIILAIIMIACGILGVLVAAKFKKKSGELNFYAFRYHQHFEDHVREEKDKETKKLFEDMLGHYDAIRWRADSIPTMSEEDVKSLFLNHIKEMSDYETRYKELSKYDSFAGSLKNDYYFNAEIQKGITETYFL